MSERWKMTKNYLHTVCKHCGLSYASTHTADDGYMPAIEIVGCEFGKHEWREVDEV